MAHDGQDITMTPSPRVENLTQTTASTLPVIDAILLTAKDNLREMVTDNGRISSNLIEAHQTAAHGVAWLTTYVQALHQMQAWASRLSADEKFGEVEQLIHQIAFGEYLAQIYGGIQMNQGEMIRLHDMGVSAAMPADIAIFISAANTQTARTRLVALMHEQSANITVGASGLDDELEMIRDDVVAIPHVLCTCLPHALPSVL